MKFINELVFVLIFGSIILIPFLALKGGFVFYNELDNDEKIELFKKKKEFICSTFNDKYFVSSKSNWKVFNNKYFKKDDLLIEILSCEIK